MLSTAFAWRICVTAGAVTLESHCCCSTDAAAVAGGTRVSHANTKAKPNAIEIVCGRIPMGRLGKGKEPRKSVAAAQVAVQRRVEGCAGYFSGPPPRTLRRGRARWARGGRGGGRGPRVAG